MCKQKSKQIFIMIKLENINTNEHNKIMKQNRTLYWC